MSDEFKNAINKAINEAANECLEDASLCFESVLDEIEATFADPTAQSLAMNLLTLAVKASIAHEFMGFDGDVVVEFIDEPLDAGFDGYSGIWVCFAPPGGTGSSPRHLVAMRRVDDASGDDDGLFNANLLRTKYDMAPATVVVKRWRSRLRGAKPRTDIDIKDYNTAELVNAGVLTMCRIVLAHMVGQEYIESESKKSKGRKTKNKAAAGGRPSKYNYKRIGELQSDFDDMVRDGGGKTYQDFLEINDDITELGQGISATHENLERAFKAYRTKRSRGGNRTTKHKP